jgi:hypothetical protein
MRLLLAVLVVVTTACAARRTAVQIAVDLDWRDSSVATLVQSSIRDSEGGELYRVFLRPLSSVEGGIVAVELVVATPAEVQAALAGSGGSLRNLLGERPGFDEACRCYPETPSVLQVRSVADTKVEGSLGNSRTMHLPRGLGTLTWELLEVRTGYGAGGCASCPLIEGSEIKGVRRPRS